MDPKIKPIPAFYCCYLLRSSVRHASLYVGSSPHPSRRLAQHNGKVKGGAVRTSRLSLRPWEMACVVAGFPSNIAALQFEWAWQNAHLSRHIRPDDRISFPVTVTKTNRRTGKTRKKPCRPRTSLVERLSNLHLLLRTTYFSQWPLELRFFSEDVYRAWKSWCERVDTQLRAGMKVVLDLPRNSTVQDDDFSSAQRSSKRRKADMIGNGGVDGVDPTYARYSDVVEKRQKFVDEHDTNECDVCKGPVNISNDLFTICTTNACMSLSHAVCLADKFQQTSSKSEIVPASGHCPRCDTEQSWSDLMRAVSLMTRGDKEVKKLLRKKRSTKADTAAELMEDETDGEEDVHDDDNASSTVETVDNQGDDSDEDKRSVASAAPARTSHAVSKHAPTSDKDTFELVIEDSEDEK